MLARHGAGCFGRRGEQGANTRPRADDVILAKFGTVEVYDADGKPVITP